MRLRLHEARGVVQYAATMRRVLLPFALALAACGTVDGTIDAALDGYAGCVTPQGCFTLDCACNRLPANATGVCGDGTDPCQVCPVTSGSTINACPTGSQCAERSQLCVGRGVVCPGSGARCLPAGSACSASGGDPPDLVGVASDAGPLTVPRCTFADDVCCPGSTADFSEPIDANFDQSVTD